MSDSFLQNILSTTKSTKVEDYNIATILSVTLFAKFSNNTEMLEMFHILEMFKKLSKNLHYNETHRQSEYITNIGEYIHHDFIKNIGKHEFVKIVKSCILYANENIEFKRIFNAWSTLDKTEQKYVGVHQNNKNINIDVRIGGRTPFKKMLIVKQKVSNHAVTIGQKDIREDYGLNKQLRFFEEFCGFCVINEQVVDNYKKMANNNNAPSSKTVFKATKMLYSHITRELNKVLTVDVGIKDNIINAMKRVLHDDDYIDADIIKYSTEYGIQSFNYESTSFMMKHQNLKFKTNRSDTPILAIVNDDNDKILQVRTRKEKYSNNITEHRYKIYLEPTELILEQLK